ncbi:hypothetical protein CPT_Moabite_224 [Serratia phage Moabite]|uniref:Uncharacterized protein n=1 Tax=Serratia phage Moabite TaxID=2587814 RepID=A0A4Y5TPF7_9CAUD|nr:hypothetical protein HWC48_gp192 [Serratia phage Moabite]QDB71254.1 hypothetical protein CPT_Moabite_224 [Serratia phage Moabite]UGO54108.1 hypothetical protein HAYMO_126 [Serratia phage vB_SmaM_Haymo]
MGLKVITKEEEEQRILETAHELIDGTSEWINYLDGDSTQVQLDGYFNLEELEAICAVKRKSLGAEATGLKEAVDLKYNS